MSSTAPARAAAPCMIAGAAIGVVTHADSDSVHPAMIPQLNMPAMFCCENVNIYTDVTTAATDRNLAPRKRYPHQRLRFGCDEHGIYFTSRKGTELGHLGRHDCGRCTFARPATRGRAALHAAQHTCPRAGLRGASA